MSDSFNVGDVSVLVELGRRLQEQGWADHVTVERLLADWQNLARSVSTYALTIDDYTNDLCSRDGLEIILHECPDDLRSKLMRIINVADAEYMQATVEDGGIALSRYYRIEAKDGWWWKRRPVAGPLARYLNAPHG